MQQNKLKIPCENLAWTSSRAEHAEEALSVVDTLLKRYGMQLTLEALIHCNNKKITKAMAMDAADDYLLNLKQGLEVTLEDYMSRNDRIYWKGRGSQ